MINILLVNVAGYKPYFLRTKLGYVLDINVSLIHKNNIYLKIKHFRSNRLISWGKNSIIIPDEHRFNVKIPCKNALKIGPTERDSVGPYNISHINKGVIFHD